MTPIMNSRRPSEGKRVRRQATSYTVVDGELFRKGFSTSLLKCLARAQAEYVLSKLHRGIYGMHSSARSMVVQVLRAGYCWPTVKRSYTEKCQECQKLFSTCPQRKFIRRRSHGPLACGG